MKIPAAVLRKKTRGRSGDGRRKMPSEFQARGILTACEALRDMFAKAALPFASGERGRSRRRRFFPGAIPGVILGVISPRLFPRIAGIRPPERRVDPRQGQPRQGQPRPNGKWQNPPSLRPPGPTLPSLGPIHGTPRVPRRHRRTPRLPAPTAPMSAWSAAAIPAFPPPCIWPSAAIR